MIIPNIWKNKTCSKPPTSNDTAKNYPAISCQNSSEAKKRKQKTKRSWQKFGKLEQGIENRWKENQLQNRQRNVLQVVWLCPVHPIANIDLYIWL
jgi:hypothetical protein